MNDINENLKPEAILDLFQTAAKDNANSLGLGQDYLRPKGYSFVLLRVKFEIVGSLNKLEEVVVETWPNVKERVEFKRQFNIQDELGNILVEGSSIWAIIDVNARRICRSDGFDFNAPSQNQEYYFSSLDKANISNLTYDEQFNYQINFDDIDLLGHLNNSKYLKLLLMYEKKMPKWVQIDYLKEVKENANLTIRHSQIDGKHFLVGNDLSNTNFVISYERTE